jgi:hypothetical protein
MTLASTAHGKFRADRELCCRTEIRAGCGGATFHRLQSDLEATMIEWPAWSRIGRNYTLAQIVSGEHKCTMMTKRVIARSS